MPSRESLPGRVGIAALTGSLLIQTGCTPAHRAPRSDDLARAERVVEPAADQTPEPAPPTGELIGPDDPDIQAALKAWKDTGEAPIIRRDDFIQYPYGLTEAVVTCQPLRVCDIELEVGEEVTNVSLSDSSRWLASPAFSGDRDTLTPHVLVKPTEFGLATNAVITTSRRTYYVALVAPTTPATHARRVKFYYPQDLVPQANGVFRAKAAERRRDQETTVAHLSRPAVDSLNFNYQIDGPSVPWKPVRVFRRRHPRLHADARGDARHGGAGASGSDTGWGHRPGELPSPPALLRRRSSTRPSSSWASALTRNASPSDAPAGPGRSHPWTRAPRWSSEAADGPSSA
jgi:P-type conjugative transfer protein TrbG